jgi:Xaa-Pro aminopeptidase
MARGLTTLSRDPSAPGGALGGLGGGVYKRGEFLMWDWGIRYLNFGTDYKRWTYILREGETDIPAGIQHAWDRGIKAREIIRKTIKVGRTAGETLEAIVHALEAENYVYTPSRDLMNALGDSDKSGFSLDCHPLGNTGNGDVAVGPRISHYGSGRAHFKIQQNNFFAFEFEINTWNPETGRRMNINFEDDAIVTEKGVEALYPRQDTIILVR